MKKLLMSLGVAAVLFLSCNINWSELTMPEQVKVETTPGLYLPLTKDLFSGEYEEYSPEKLIKDNLSPKKIKEMIGDMSGITVSTYEDSANPGVLTYLLRYPLAEMPFDLSQYMGDLEIAPPDGAALTVTLPPKNPLIPLDQVLPIPFPPVIADIRDMANLVTSLKYTAFGIKIEGDFENALEVRITDGNGSADGFNLTSTGKYETDGYTYFIDTNNEWKPSKDRPTLAIEMELTAYPNAASNGGIISIAPAFELDWTEVTVNPGNSGTLEGEMPLDFTSLGETLDGIEFKSVEAYLYTSGLPDSNAEITLESSSSGKLVDGKALTEASAPALPTGDEPYTGAFLPSSLSSGAILLTNTLNSSLSNEVKLSYTLVMGSLTLEKAALTQAKTISAVLLIKLPLALKYSGVSFESSTTADYKEGSAVVDKSKYLKFEMDDLAFSDIIGEDDLLESIKGDFGGDGVSGRLDLDTISLVLTNCDASLLPNVCIAIKQNEYAPTGVLIDLSHYDLGSDIPIDLEVDMNNPFAPSIDILLKKDKDEDGALENFATLSLNEDGHFKFGLRVEIESTLDVTVDL